MESWTLIQSEMNLKSIVGISQISLQGMDFILKYNIIYVAKIKHWKISKKSYSLSCVIEIGIICQIYKLQLMSKIIVNFPLKFFIFLFSWFSSISQGFLIRHFYRKTTQWIDKLLIMEIFDWLNNLVSWSSLIFLLGTINWNP